VLSVAFSPDGRTLLTGGPSKLDPSRPQTTEGKLWDPVTLQEVGSLPALRGTLAGVIFSKDGRTLALALAEGGLALLDFDPETRQARLRQQLKPFSRQLSLTADGLLAARAPATPISLFDARTGEPLRVLPTPPGNAGGLAFSPDGKWLAEGQVTGPGQVIISLWDIDKRQRCHSWPAHTKRINVLAFAPSGEQLASASEDSTVKCWRVSDHSLQLTLRGHETEVLGLAYSPDGRVLASADYKGVVKLWDPERGQERASFTPAGAKLGSLAFSPDSRMLVAVGMDGSVWCWATPRR
jgi:WD40 repeat protein